MIERVDEEIANREEKLEKANKSARKVGESEKERWNQMLKCAKTIEITELSW